jgi:Aspartyl protease
MHRALLATAAAVCFVESSLARPASAVEAVNPVLARYSAYVGRPDATVVTYRHTVAAAPSPAPAAAAGDTAAELPATEWTTYRRGALYHEIDRGAGVSTESGFTGRAFWLSNENRYSVIALEDAARRLITENAIDANLLGPDTDVRDRGTQTVDGTPADVIRVTPRGGIPADLAIDKTGAALQITFEPDDPNQRRVKRVLSYTEIAPGVRVPAAMRLGRQTFTLLHGSVRAVSDDELKGPPPTATWSFGGPAPIRIERRTYGGRAVTVEASINGHPGRFLLDSGASQILLYRPYADSLGLTMLGETSYSGVNGGVRTARFARAATIAVGDNTLSNVVVAVSGRDPADKDAINGILGFDLLAGAVVHVDLAHETIAFGDPAAVEPVVGKTAAALPVNLADFTPELPVKVAGVATRATLDTGNDFFMTLSDNLKTSGRLVSLRRGSVLFTGVDGAPAEPDSCYDVNESVIGPYRYQNITVCLGKERVFGRDGGLIGFDFLRHFNWTFDYTRSRIVLTPNGL